MKNDQNSNALTPQNFLEYWHGLERELAINIRGNFGDRGLPNDHKIFGHIKWQLLFGLKSLGVKFNCALHELDVSKVDYDSMRGLRLDATGRKEFQRIAYALEAAAIIDALLRASRTCEAINFAMKNSELFTVDPFNVPERFEENGMEFVRNPSLERDLQPAEREILIRKHKGKAYAEGYLQEQRKSAPSNRDIAERFAALRGNFETNAEANSAVVEYYRGNGIKVSKRMVLKAISTGKVGRPKSVIKQ